MPTRFIAVLATVALAAGATSAFADDGGDNHNDKVLEADIFGSHPDDAALFGVAPGGAPWVISRGEAEVRHDGRVEVKVEGLVIPTPPQNGTNPLPGIAATVFCGGKAVGTTKSVPFSADGDARIDDRLARRIPSPCVVPAVLLNPKQGAAVNQGVYIAATGVR